MFAIRTTFKGAKTRGARISVVCGGDRMIVPFDYGHGDAWNHDEAAHAYVRSRLAAAKEPPMREAGFYDDFPTWVWEGTGKMRLVSAWVSDVSGAKVHIEVPVK